jgi:REP element-mobilizing transposase RayT
MSVRSYTKIWLHLIWGTYNHANYLPDRSFRKKLSQYFYEYSELKNICMRINYVNSDHVHTIIDLPTNITIEDVFHLYKGSSSNWINKHVIYKFSWGKGYAAFSVSESNMDKAVKYIVGQEGHHRNISFTEEYEEFLKKYNVLVNR